MNIILNSYGKTDNVQPKIYDLGKITTTLQDLLDNSTITIDSKRTIILSIIDIDDNTDKYILPLDDYIGNFILGIGKDIKEDDLIKISSTKSLKEPKYKIFTALLTQSGDASNQFISSGLLTIGTTYNIYEVISGSPDFTNVGAPNNNVGTVFIATGTTPNSWGEDATLIYINSSPVAKVLDNTIGNIWFEYAGVGLYIIASNGLFVENKTTCTIGSIFYPSPAYSNTPFISFAGDYIGSVALPNKIGIVQSFGDPNNSDGLLINTPIEIRVYN